MIRKAVPEELDAVERLYNELHDAKEAGLIPTIWRRGVYPSRATAQAALARDDLFVMEEDGRIIGSAIINGIQNDFYAGVPWRHRVPDEQVCVLHTLMIAPSEFRKGHAREFLAFYEQYALKHGCTELRLDTNERNTVAQDMYRRHGYTKAGTVPTRVFNGISGVKLVLMEKYIGPEEEKEP